MSFLLSFAFAAFVAWLFLSASSFKEEGDALFRKKRYEEALEKYKKIEPRSAQRCLLLALTYKKLGKLSAAVKSAKRGLRLGDGRNQHHGTRNDLEELLAELTVTRAKQTCRQCGKDPADLVCKRCEQVVYCSEQCQTAHWPHHKKHECARKRDGSSDTTNHERCQNCAKRLSEGNLKECARCKQPYCSRECQREHYPLHKMICKATATTNQQIDEYSDPALSAWKRIFDRWKDGGGMYLCHLATFAMTKKEFKQQPPSFVIVIKVVFNYNYATFVPVGSPKKVPITQAVLGFEPAALKQAFENASNFRGAGMLAFTHVIIIETDTPCRSASIQPVLIPASSFQSEPHVVNGMKANCLFPRQLLNWKPLVLHNLTHQISVLRNEQVVFAQFVSWALRLSSRNPLGRTHILLVNFEPGVGLGEIGKLKEFEVLPLAQATNKLSGAFPSAAELQSLMQKYFGRRSNRTNTMLIPVFFTSDAGMTLSEVSIIVNGQGRKPDARCDEMAHDSFIKLQSIPLPHVESPCFDEI